MLHSVLLSFESSSSSDPVSSSVSSLSTADQHPFSFRIICKWLQMCSAECKHWTFLLACLKMAPHSPDWQEIIPSVMCTNPQRFGVTTENFLVFPDILLSVISSTGIVKDLAFLIDSSSLERLSGSMTLLSWDNISSMKNFIWQHWMSKSVTRSMSGTPTTASWRRVV